MALVRNTFSNLLGVALPALVALIAIPQVVKAFGVALFGLYSLQIALLFFLGLNDFGISRAIVLLSFDDRFSLGGRWVRPFEIGSHYVKILVLSLIALGACFVGALAASSVAGVAHHDDFVASSALIVVSAAFTVAALPARAVLEVDGRFLLMNLVRGPSAAVLFVAPLIPINGARSLTSAAEIILVTRAIAFAAFIGLARTGRTEEIAWRASESLGDAHSRKIFLKRAGWLGSSNFLSLAISYMDRFVLGAVAGAEQIAHYVIAQELATKVWIGVGAAVSGASPSIADERRTSTTQAPSGSTRRLVGLVVTIGLLPSFALIVAARPILNAWLGADVAAAAALPLMILAAGIGLNTLAQVNYCLLQIGGGESHGAMLQLFNIGLGLLMLVPLAEKYGATGAAVAFSLRLLVDAYLGRLLLTRRVGPSGVSYSALTLAVFGLLVAMLSSLYLFQ